MNHSYPFLCCEMYTLHQAVRCCNRACASTKYGNLYSPIWGFPCSH